MPTTSPLPAEWSKVLDSMHATLTQALQLVEAREAALDSPVSTNREPTEVSNSLDDRLTNLDERSARLRQPLVDLDANLQTEEEAIRAHLAQVAQLRQRLAEWAGRAIG